MAATKSLVYIFTILLPLVLVLAQESSSIPGLPSIPSIPSIPGLPSMSSGLPTIPGLPNFAGFGQFAHLFGKRESPADGPGSSNSEHHDGEGSEHHDVEGSDGHDPDHEHQDRLFFTFFPIVTSCNFTTAAGRTCRSCNQALTCLPNNVGLLRTCRGLFRYCNNGRCSIFRGSACDATTTTSSTSSTSTSTSTTSSTTSTTTPASG